MTRPLRILHLEDSPRDADLIEHELTHAGLSVDIALVDSQARFDAALNQVFDLILCDYNIPGYAGAAAVARAVERQPQTPLIVVSGTVSEVEAVHCLHLGATDYLHKQRLERLAPAVRRALEEFEQRRLRQAAEEALQLRERWLSSIFDTVADGLFYLAVDAQGSMRVLSANGAFLQMTGLTGEHVLGRLVDDVLPGSSLRLLLDGCAESIATRGVVRWEMTTDFAGRRVTGAVSVAPVFTADGHCSHIVGAVHDVTARRQIEAELRQLQKMEAVGRLAAGVAHDFNNLLTAVIGYGQFIVDALSPGQPARADAERIVQLGERAATLTRQLLAFSRTRTVTPKVLDLHKAVAELSSLLTPIIGEDVELVVAPQADAVAYARIDVGQLEQVVTNLVVNARDAMSAGGVLRIDVGTRVVAPGAAGPNDPPPGAHAIISVADTGCGMDDGTRARIFDPFFTTKEPGRGTGLGLSVVYGIVQQCGGAIRVESTVGLGTTFHVYLPLTEAPVASAALAADTAGAAVPAPMAAGGSGTIMVAEDDSRTREILRTMLTRIGYAVVDAEDGVAALELAARHNGAIDLLVTDLVMPRMGGRELADRLTAARPDTKVLYTSGYGGRISDDDLAGGRAFLPKPYSRDTLAGHVRAMLSH